MRAGLTVLLIGVVLAIAPAASAGSATIDKNGVFPDLPGMGLLDRQTDVVSSVTSSDAATSDDAVKHDRVPALDPNQAVITELASKLGDPTIAEMPGGGVLDGGVHAVGYRGPSNTLQLSGWILLALAFTALWARALVRLNTVR